MWTRSGAGSLLKLMLMLMLLIGLPPSAGLKCGIHAVDLKSKETVLGTGFLSGISSWRNSTVAGHPRQVSLKLGENHFCGGSLIQDDLVVTAAHCLAGLKEQIKSLMVTAGEYSLFQKDEEEQNIPVSKTVIHPEYNTLGYRSFDIALLYLKHSARFGTTVQPICIPQRADTFEEGILCKASGWGKISETAEYSNVLQEVELPMVDARTCSTTLKGVNLAPLGRTMLCARFPDGEQDACQGDSGGPLVCRREDGVCVLAGITSWGVGCARDWNPLRNNQRRTSLGIFSKVSELIEFIIQTIVTGGLPANKIILIKFTSLDIENQVESDHDYVSLQSSNGVLIGKVCGNALPSPLLTGTNEATGTFVTDAENSGRGFELTFSVVRKNSEGENEGVPLAIHLEFPLHFRRYLIYSIFECFSLNDVLPVFGFLIFCHYTSDFPKTLTAKLCGLLNPAPIFSPGNMMAIPFKSDGENNFRGFKARVTFLPSDSLNKIGSTSSAQTNSVSSVKAIPYSACGLPPVGPQWLSRRIAVEEEACPHCWPWQVGLRFLGSHHCGGMRLTILKNNPLLWTIVAGDHDRTLEESTEQVRRAKHIVVHEDFDTLTYDSDIALIQLSSALEFNSVVRPVWLPHNTEPPSASEICVVTGWGSISEGGGLARRLQQIQVPVLEREVCERNYYSAHPGGISEKMICAGSAASGGKDIGQGDSGGPLVCKHEKGPFVLYGIVSWGAGYAQPRKPGVFSRVSVFLEWIQSKIKGKSLFRYYENSASFSEMGCYSEVELEEPRGFFSSPRYPLDYRGKLECSWVLRVSPNSMAKFTVEYLSLPESHMCRDSALTIYEENHSERRMSGELCGRRLYPMIFMSSGPLVRVTFHSHVQGAFGISYIVFGVQGPKGSKMTKCLQSSNQEFVATCEEVILTKPAGTIQIPRCFHRATRSCHWRLLAPFNHVIRLDIIDCQLKPVPLACQGHLWVYDGFGSDRKFIVGFVMGTLFWPFSNYYIMALSLSSLHWRKRKKHRERLSLQRRQKRLQESYPIFESLWPDLSLGLT
uniref:Ovochymase 1 n=1 Tax=Catagonus wagneri TaxID=51154 RepID=A0A8C3WS52_9CETA